MIAIGSWFHSSRARREKSLGLVDKVESVKLPEVYNPWGLCSVTAFKSYNYYGILIIAALFIYEYEEGQSTCCQCNSTQLYSLYALQVYNCKEIKLKRDLREKDRERKTRNAINRV